MGIFRTRERPPFFNSSVVSSANVNVVSPTSTLEGTINLIAGSGATGDFLGREGHIAIRENDAWIFLQGTHRQVSTDVGIVTFQPSGISGVTSQWVRTEGTTNEVFVGGGATLLNNSAPMRLQRTARMPTNSVVRFNANSPTGICIGMVGQVLILYGAGANWQSLRFDVVAGFASGGSVVYNAGIAQQMAFNFVNSQGGSGGFGIQTFGVPTILTGTTGSAGNVTFAYSNPNFYFENRAAFTMTVTFDLTLIQESLEA